MSSTVSGLKLVDLPRSDAVALDVALHGGLEVADDEGHLGRVYKDRFAHRAIIRRAGCKLARQDLVENSVARVNESIQFRSTVLCFFCCGRARRTVANARRDPRRGCRRSETVGRVVTYDERQAAAARLAGLRTVQPGT
jgi:hypothetical protein